MKERARQNHDGMAGGFSRDTCEPAELPKPKIIIITSENYIVSYNGKIPYFSPDRKHLPPIAARNFCLLVIFQHNILASLLALLLVIAGRHFAQSNWFDLGETLETFTSWLYLA